MNNTNRVRTVGAGYCCKSPSTRMPSGRSFHFLQTTFPFHHWQTEFKAAIVGYSHNIALPDMKMELGNKKKCKNQILQLVLVIFGVLPVVTKKEIVCNTVHM